MKFSLKANPTFKAKVAIPIPGGDSVQVGFEFKHRSKDELKTYLTDIDKRTDDEVLTEIVTGWELDDPFSKENLHELTQQYHGAGVAILEKYLAEMIGRKEKN